MAGGSFIQTGYVENTGGTAQFSWGGLDPAESYTLELEFDDPEGLYIDGALFYAVNMNIVDYVPGGSYTEPLNVSQRLGVRDKFSTFSAGGLPTDHKCMPLCAWYSDLSVGGYFTLLRESEETPIRRYRYTARLAGAAPAVPEPATWAMLVAGFSLIGSALRVRRRPAPRHA